MVGNRQKKAFVTGATGFLGTHIVERLLMDGWEVHALARPTSNRSLLKHTPTLWHLGDVTDKKSLLEAIPLGVDAIFHTAADTSMWRKHNAQQHLTNVDGTRNIIDAALTRGAKRLIHTSTIAVWDVHDQTITEDTPRKGGDSWVGYYRTKYEAEELVLQAVRERGLDAVILNPCHIVGRYDRHNWAQMIQMVGKENLPGIPPGSGSFGHGQEVARAHVTAAESAPTGERYILGGVHASFVDLVRVIGAELGKRVPGSAVPYSALRAVTWLHGVWHALWREEPDLTPEKAYITSVKIHTDSSKAVSELGYDDTIPLEHMIRDAIAWMRTQNLL